MQLTDQIPPELKISVEGELQSEESISWIEMPIPKFFTPKSKNMFIFAIVWTLFAIFWICAAAGFTIPDLKGGSDPFQIVQILFPIFGLPFLLIGIGLLLSPIFEYRKALKTVYVITDRRAITFEGGWSKTVRSYPPAKLLDVYRKERRDGTGDVIISSHKGDDSERGTFSEDLGFLRIREPEKVELMLNDLVKEAGIDISIKPPQDSVLQGSERSFRSRETTLNESALPQPKASTRIGKVIVVLVFSILFGYFLNASSLQDYKKGQTLTLNEYVECFEAHKAKLLYHNSLWLEILFVFLVAGFLFALYELLGKGLGWALWRAVLKRKGREGSWREP